VKLKVVESSFAKAMEEFPFDGLGDFGWRSARDVMGRIYPECHSSSDRERGGGTGSGRRRRMKRVSGYQEIRRQDTRRSGYQGNRSSKFKV
jgi:hypothetical protein